MMTEDDVRQMIRERAGPRGIAKWCRENGIMKQHVSEFLTGHRGPGPTMLKILRLKKVYTNDDLPLQSSADGAK